MTLTLLNGESVITRAEAFALGASKREVGRLGPRRILRGYYSTVLPTPLGVRVRAGLAVAGEGARVCGQTALSLAGVDLPWRLEADTRLWFQVPPSKKTPRPQMRLVRSEREDPEIMLGGVPSVALPHCWLQVAAESSVDELVAVADALTRRQRPKSEKDLLALAVAEREGTRGIRKARLALDLCVEGTDSIPETFLRLAVIRGGLPCPAVNHRVSNSWGDVEYYLDLAYPDKMVAIEYDGAYHVGDRNQMAKDATRRRFLEDHGWRVITATAIDLKSPNSLLTSIRRARS